MKTCISGVIPAIIGGGVVAAAFLIGGAGRLAQPDKPAKEPQPKPELIDPALQIDMQNEIAAYLKFMSPGAPHAALKKFTGEWTTTTRMWMDPAGKPLESEGKASFKLILGGRFLQQTTQGSMMGTPTEGLGLMGFDNFRNQYTGTWCDTMSTTIYHMSGGASRDGKSIVMFGSMDEPNTKEIGKPVKWVVRSVDDNKFFFEAFEVIYGDPFKVMEVEYTRAK